MQTSSKAELQQKSREKKAAHVAIVNAANSGDNNNSETRLIGKLDNQSGCFINRVEVLMTSSPGRVDLIFPKLMIKKKDQMEPFNHTLATILVQYASAVYITDLTALFSWTCTRCDDLTKDFEITDLIIDVPNCLQAFVGVTQDLNSVIIAFRGTQE